MNRWIFVIKDSDDEFQHRINTKTWPIFNKTKNRKKLSIGDLILFYKAGTNGQKFLGTAIINTDLKELDSETYFLKIRDILVWKNRVSVRRIISKLDFIKNKSNWGNHFQGGVRIISEKDFLTITNSTKFS